MSTSARAAMVALFAIGLAGCANPRSEQAVIARTALIGMPEEVLLSCAGVPDRSRSEGYRDYFTYMSERLYSTPRASFGVFGGSGHFGTGIGIPYGMNVHSDMCEATFTLENGIVSDITYNTVPGIGSRYGQCYYIVQNCLGGAPIAN